MRRLTLSLTNLVKTLEITTKQLKSIILFYTYSNKNKFERRQKPKFSCYYIFAQSTAVMSHQFVTRSHTCEKILFQDSCQAVQRTFKWKSNCLCKSNINGTLSTCWPMFTSGKKLLNLSFCRYLHMSQEDFFQPIFLVLYIGWEQRRKAYGPHL